MSARSFASVRVARTRLCINRIDATTEKPSRARAVVSTATSWRLKSSSDEIVRGCEGAAASAAPAKGNVARPQAVRLRRAAAGTSAVHDSSVRRSSTITPDMVAPETDEETARFRARRFPHQRESNQDIAKRSRAVRVQTVNADFAVQKSRRAAPASDFARTESLAHRPVEP